MARLYNAHGGQLWRAILTASAGRREIADDVTAEAFARLMAHQHTVREPLPWLFRTGFRLMAKELKRERSAAEPGAEPVASPAAEFSPELTAALRSLSVEQRIAVYLHYYADMPVSEVARLSGSSTTAVKVRLHRARRQLRVLLDGGEVVRV